MFPQPSEMLFSQILSFVLNILASTWRTSIATNSRTEFVVYRGRFWLTGAEFDEVKAAFSHLDNERRAKIVVEYLDPLSGDFRMINDVRFR